ncbi:MAG: MSMEG_0570 family nitrogen starvation response protein [Actinomycetota bacterium]
MPEMTFELQWPDGTRQRCYSPSLVMHDYLQTGTSYTVAEFVRRSGTALAIASERVRAKYGFACTSAAATTDEIRSSAARFPADAVMVVTSMRPAMGQA